MKIDKIIRSQRRTIGLQINADASLIVRAPKWAKMVEINEVVFKHFEWIQKKQAEALNNQRYAPARNYDEGDEFSYLGKRYKLYITKDSQFALSFKEAFYLSQRFHQAGRIVFAKWYKIQAKSIIPQRVQLYAGQANLKYGQIGITNAVRRWGSCNHKGNLNFAWRLVMAPIESIDYVVAHELAHLEVKNHSKSFWDKVEYIYPGYEKHKAWLRENERLLTL
jgi:predicted metal-dependent hydrolase